MLSGVILAGGKGSRIGGDKGLFSVGGQPMIAHVLRALSSIADDIVLAVGEGAGPAYRDLLGPRAKTVEDRAPGRGPLEGLLNAFSAAEHEYVAVVPCDIPFVSPTVIELLASRAAGLDAAIPVVNGYLEPLVAVYNREAGLREFGLELDSGVRKVADAIRRMDICRVEEADLRTLDMDLRSFWNVNSKEDLAKADMMARDGVTPPLSLPSTD